MESNSTRACVRYQPDTYRNVNLGCISNISLLVRRCADAIGLLERYNEISTSFVCSINVSIYSAESKFYIMFDRLYEARLEHHD